MKCKGCDTEIDMDWHGFCSECIKLLPPYPSDGGYYAPLGDFPNMRWESDEEITYRVLGRLFPDVDPEILLNDKWWRRRIIAELEERLAERDGSSHNH